MTKQSFPPFEQAQYERDMERRMEEFMNEPEEIEFTVNGQQYMALVSKNKTEILDDMLDRFLMFRVEYDDVTVLEHIVFAYVAGLKLGRQRGESDAKEKIRKALGVF